MVALALVALGGAVGSAGRSAIALALPESPLAATLLVNVVGAFALGALIAVLTVRRRRGGTVVNKPDDDETVSSALVFCSGPDSAVASPRTRRSRCRQLSSCRIRRCSLRPDTHWSHWSPGPRPRWRDSPWEGLSGRGGRRGRPLCGGRVGDLLAGAATSRWGSSWSTSPVHCCWPRLGVRLVHRGGSPWSVPVLAVHDVLHRERRCRDWSAPAVAERWR